MSSRILVAEDDCKQADLVRRYLDHAGHETAVVHDGRAALDHVRRRAPDLLVLDLTLPLVDGMAVCRALRGELPIVMLTARTREDDLVRGLAVGADDYVTKPYRPRELVARIEAVLRRSGPVPYRVGDLAVDPARHEVRVRGALVSTTPGEFALLSCLAAAPGRVFTREVLLERTGGYGRDVTARAIDMHVLNLRRKIEPEPGRPRYLRTVYGIGYKLADGS